MRMLVQKKILKGRGNRWVLNSNVAVGKLNSLMTTYQHAYG